MATERETTPAIGKELAATLDGADLVAAYRTMVLSRTLEERMWVLSRQGKAKFAIGSWGHEAAQVGCGLAIRRGLDFVFPYYRSLALALTLGVPPAHALMGLLGKADDPSSRGRQFPMHFSYPAWRIVTRSSVVGTQVPQAAGAALAARIKGEPSVAFCFFGEGATSEGDWHEGMNFAGVLRLPVVFVCENNGYAVSVSQRRQMPVQDVAVRAAAYGMPGVIVDGGDVAAVYAAAARAADRARRGEGPTLLEAKVVRLRPHSSDDDDRLYRLAEELAEDQRRDPLPCTRERLLVEGILTEADDERLRQEIARLVDEATDLAEAAPYGDPAGIERHLYGDPAGQA